ncbi:MAG TPA: hypothetical protein VGG34_09015 [Opitutaceae bacterium]|jgi:hypothetical protein
MRTLLLMIVLAAAGPAGARAPEQGLGDAASARSLLGAGPWARIVRIENSNPSGFFSRGSYPKVVYGLVFEMSGILWFYTDTDGTQSLSLTRGTVGRDERDPGPLFLGVEKGFRAWSWVDESRVPRGPSGRPPNACFIESVAEAVRRAAVGTRVLSPELLSYYVDTPHGRVGHTVLIYDSGSGLVAVDGESAGRPVRIPAGLGADLRAISAFLRGGPVSAVRTLPIFCERRPGARGDQWAALPAPPLPQG